jgi:hypothetical protein
MLTSGCRAAAPLHPYIFPGGFSNILQFRNARLSGVGFALRRRHSTHRVPKLSPSHVVKHRYE